MEVIQLYKSVLASMNVRANEDGLLSMELHGESLPLYCQKKRLALPIQSLLRSGNWEGLQPFHPVSESVYRGESPVLKELRKYINLRLMEIVASQISELVKVAADTDLHKKLKPTQVELLKCLKDADERTINDFQKIINKSDPNGATKLVGVYLKRGGKLGGDEFMRLAKVSFPIVDEFDNSDRTIFGVKLRVKDFEGFRKFFNYLIPDCEVEDSYSYGSRSMSAPYLHALLSAYAKVAHALNKTTRKFTKYIEDSDSLLINLDWEEHLDKFEQFRTQIPALDGNDGEPMTGVDTETSDQMAGKEPKAAPAPSRVQPKTSHLGQSTVHARQEVAAPQDDAPPFEPDPVSKPPSHPAAKPKSGSGGGVSWDSYKNQQTAAQQPQQPMYPQPQPQPGYYQQPQPQYGYQQQPQMNHYPGYPPQQQPYQGPPPNANPRDLGYQTQWGAPAPQYGQQPNYGYGQPQQAPGPYYAGGPNVI